MTDAELKRKLAYLRRRASRFKTTLLAAFEQARKDLRNEVLSRPNRALSLSDQPYLMGLVDDRLNRLAKQLRQQIQTTVVNAVDTEMKNALQWTRTQNPEAAYKLPSAYEQATLRNALVSDLEESMKAALQDVRTKVQRDLTQAALQERSLYSAAGVILGQSARDGIRPAFASSYPRVSAIAKSEFMRAINSTVVLAYKGMDDVEYEWMSAGCACGCRVCHSELSGQRRKPGQPFTSSMGSRLAPPAHPYCRCYLVARRVAR